MTHKITCRNCNAFIRSTTEFRNSLFEPAVFRNPNIVSPQIKIDSVKAWIWKFNVQFALRRFWCPNNTLFTRWYCVSVVLSSIKYLCSCEDKNSRSLTQILFGSAVSVVFDRLSLELDWNQLSTYPQLAIRLGVGFVNNFKELPRSYIVF